MDVQHPYANSEARLRLLYSLPLPTERSCLLQVGASKASMPLWPGALQHLTLDELPGLPQQLGGAVDAVALPSTVDALACAAELDALFMSVHRLLRPGGVVVGHCRNPWALKALGHTLGWRRLRRLAGAGGPVGSAAGCAQALSRAGFDAVQCSYVQPDMADPMGLIPSDRQAARAQFLRITRAERGHFHPADYAARIALAWAGWGGAQQREVFYWGCKPC